jgi:hypothetical protein
MKDGSLKQIIRVEDVYETGRETGEAIYSWAVAVDDAETSVIAANRIMTVDGISATGIDLAGGGGPAYWSIQVATSPGSITLCCQMRRFGRMNSGFVYGCATWISHASEEVNFLLCNICLHICFVSTPRLDRVFKAHIFIIMDIFTPFDIFYGFNGKRSKPRSCYYLDLLLSDLVAMGMAPIYRYDILVHRWSVHT